MELPFPFPSNMGGSLKVLIIDFGLGCCPYLGRVLSM
jgi:hypothetical protein